MRVGKQIERVAVIGAGIMGSGIAAHCAANGLQVLLLDLAAKDGARSAIAEAAKARMAEGRAPLLDDAADLARIETGNFDDDLGRIAEADLIVEAVIEDLAIKRALFEKLEAHRSDGSILVSNTSGIPLQDAYTIEADIMSDGNRRGWAAQRCRSPGSPAPE